MTGFGGVVSFELAGDKETTSRFIDAVQLPYIGPTLGGVEGIIQQQALFISLDPAERAKAGIKDTLVRYALGIEDADDIIADLAQALEQVGGVGGGGVDRQNHKFGNSGTSVGNAERFAAVADIVLAQPQENVVVVSAMSGVTNKLIAGARAAAEGRDSVYRTDQGGVAGQAPRGC